MLNGKINVGESVSIFPISNWTELNVWNYIKEENLALPSIYFSHERVVIERDGLYWPFSNFSIQPKMKFHLKPLFASELLTTWLALLQCFPRLAL